MRRSVVPVAVVATAVVALALKLTVSASAAADVPWVVFSAHPEGTALQQLFRVQSNGEGLQQISKGAAPATDPAFSPDGKKLVWASNRGDAAGTSSTNLFIADWK